MSESVDNQGSSNKSCAPLRLVRDRPANVLPLATIQEFQRGINLRVNARIRMAQDEMSDPPLPEEIAALLTVIEDERNYWERKLNHITEAK